MAAYAIIDAVGIVESIGLAVALFILNASLTFQSAWPTPGVRWQGLLSIELVVLVVALAAVTARGRMASARILRGVAIVWSALALSHYAEVTAAALYGRELNLYWDLRFVPDVTAMLANPTRVWVVVLAVAAVLCGLGLLYVVIRWAIGRVAVALAQPWPRRVISGAAGLIAILWIGQHVGAGFPERPQFAAPVSETYVRQARLLSATLSGSADLPPSPPMNSDLSLIKGADVFLFFIEAYGAISYERPEFAGPVAADRARLETAIHDSKHEVVSAFVTSPTFGGSSWLAHITLLSGVDIRSHDANALLMTERRGTLVTRFKEHGYRAIAVMPGLWQDWPEGAFYKFDEIYGGSRLDYHGPPFGWWDMTDQFVLARLKALEVDRAERPPLFVLFPTISTHIPFVPTPPYQPDWSRILTDHPYDEAEVNRAYLQQPDWLDLGRSYAGALSYMYKSLAGFLRLPTERDFVMVMVGDHQPAAAVSGEGASWDVPVHVIANRRELLDRLVAAGFRPGLTPARPSLGPMSALTSTLLDAFGNHETPIARMP